MKTKAQKAVLAKIKREIEYLAPWRDRMSRLDRTMQIIERLDKMIQEYDLKDRKYIMGSIFNELMKVNDYEQAEAFAKRHGL